MPKAPTPMDDFYFIKKVISEMSGIQKHHLDYLVETHGCANGNETGFPVFGIMRALYTEWMRYKNIIGSARGANSDDDELKMDFLLKKEKVQKERILNQTKLGLMIPKEEASNRVRGSLKAVMNTIKSSIKTIAPYLVNIPESRDVETIIAKHWNKCIAELEAKSKVVEWEVDGTHSMLETRLNKLKELDEAYGGL